MSRFLVNLGYKWSAPVGGHGFVVNASGVDAEQLLRRAFSPSPDQWLLFDPQLYLASLDSQRCPRVCARLATYRWFGIDTPEFASQDMNRTQWLAKVQSQVAWKPSVATASHAIHDAVCACFRLQAAFGVTHLIAPAPLASSADEQFAAQLQWWRTAVEVKNAFSAPMLGSLALSEHLLAATAPEDNLTLQTALDSVTTYGFDGAYLVVVRDNAETMRLLQPNVVRAVLYASARAGSKYGKQVVVNFVDDFGLACLAAGATAFASGSTIKQRRMCLADFSERDGGGPYPHFYSNAFIGDFSIDDMHKVQAAGLLDLLAKDETPASTSLLTALRADRSASDVPGWRPTINNVAEASAHRIALLGLATERLRGMGQAASRDAICEWLDQAQNQQMALDACLRDDPVMEDLRHVAVWRAAF